MLRQIVFICLFVPHETTESLLQGSGRKRLQALCHGELGPAFGEHMLQVTGHKCKAFNFHVALEVGCGDGEVRVGCRVQLPFQKFFSMVIAFLKALRGICVASEVPHNSLRGEEYEIKWFPFPNNVALLCVNNRLQMVAYRFVYVVIYVL